MITTMLGKKIGMTQVFNDRGVVIPVTVIELQDALVVEKKTEARDGYNAIQLGYGDVKKQKSVNKPMKGIFNKAKLAYKKILKEVRVSKDELAAVNVGDIIKPESLKVLEGKFVDISGTSKGKGFQGVMKRHNFSGGPDGHGSMQHRAPGSIGSSTYPARVFKNQKMPGHMGDVRVTVQNLLVHQVDAENNFILVRGAVPGANGGVIEIKKSVKKK